MSWGDVGDARRCCFWSGPGHCTRESSCAWKIRPRRRGMKRRAKLIQEFFSLGELQVEEAAQKLEASGDPKSNKNDSALIREQLD